MGSNRLGDVMSPASVADCLTFRSAASIPQYVCAAACTPYAPCPR